MEYLPLTQKSLIQTSYVRYRELIIETSEAGKRVMIGRALHWGGLATFVVFLTRSLIGKDLPSFVGTVGLLALVFGWAYKHDQRKKEDALWAEYKTIRKEMKEVGVSFVEVHDRVIVYAETASSSSEVSPLIDDCYR